MFEALGKAVQVDEESFRAKEAAGLTWDQIRQKIAQRAEDCAAAEPQWERDKREAGLTLEQIRDRSHRSESGYVKQHEREHERTAEP
jgi:uncharacterized membrane protein